MKGDQIKNCYKGDGWIEEEHCWTQCNCIYIYSYLMVTEFDLSKIISLQNQWFGEWKPDLSDLESACRLVARSYLKSEKILTMRLHNIDISSISTNLMKNVTEKVSTAVDLFDIKNFHASMLENLDCGWLRMESMNLKDSQVSKSINVRGRVVLDRVQGDLQGLLDNINCDWLEMRDMSLSCNETKSLVQMLSHRVRRLDLMDGVRLEECGSFLNEYEGNGRCKLIVLYKDVWENYLEDVVLWAKSVDWVFEKNPYFAEFSPYQPSSPNGNRKKCSIL